jgi:hypothetical protein
MKHITDARVRDEDALPDVLPGEAYERVITPQRHVILRRIRCDLCLERLKVGPIEVPFEITADNGQIWFKPIWLEKVRRDLERVGSGVRGADGVLVVAGLDVRVTLRNERDVPVKPRLALIGEEVESP